MTLSYLRQNTSFQWLGIMFGVSETTANTIFHDWLKILSSILPPSLLKEVQDDEGEREEVLELLSDIELIVDASEQSYQRPQAKEEREKLYSGYKQNYTSKNFYSAS